MSSETCEVQRINADLSSTETVVSQKNNVRHTCLNLPTSPLQQVLKRMDGVPAEILKDWKWPACSANSGQPELVALGRRNWRIFTSRLLIIEDRRLVMTCESNVEHT